MNDLKIMRLKKSCTLKELGTILGLTEQTCSKLEKNPNLFNIGQVKKLMGEWDIDEDKMLDIFLETKLNISQQSFNKLIIHQLIKNKNGKLRERKWLVYMNYHKYIKIFNHRI